MIDLDELKAKLAEIEEDYKRKIAAILARVNERYMKQLRDELTSTTN